MANEDKIIKRGRPSKSASSYKLTSVDHAMRCSCCGDITTDPKKIFQKSSGSAIFSANGDYAGICVHCIGSLYMDYSSRFDDKTAMVIICHYLDLYFNEQQFDKLRVTPNYSIDTFIRLMTTAGNKNKSFATYIKEQLDKRAHDAIDERTAVNDMKWSVADLRNKKYVIQTIGYDCFVDESYSDADAKLLYNTLAEYLTDDIVEDAHKVQSVISMVKTLLQVEKTDRLINAELLKRNSDEDTLKILGEVKSNFVRVVNNIANENGIAAKTSGKQKAGTSTLTYILKQMYDDGFVEAKANLYNAKLSESYQEIAEANARALFNELQFTSDEYARMVSEQSVKLADALSKIETLQEENRLLKIKLEDPENLPMRTLPSSLSERSYAENEFANTQGDTDPEEMSETPLKEPNPKEDDMEDVSDADIMPQEILDEVVNDDNATFSLSELKKVSRQAKRKASTAKRKVDKDDEISLAWVECS